MPVAPRINRAGPAVEPDGDRLDRLLAERGVHLLHAAIALTGSRLDAEDLLQAAVERLLRRRRRVDDLESYLRRILYNLAADGWRRRGAWRRMRRLLPSQAGHDTGLDPIATVDLRDALVRALRELPPRQRAVLVLRYWEQLTQAETAELLGCSEGTVKSAASRGLSRLRELAAPWHDSQSQLANETRMKETP
jgi:RNA polymerase sigma-70 factor (sigma-E family)